MTKTAGALAASWSGDGSPRPPLRRAKGKIAAHRDQEPMNFLAINLANAVVIGQRTVEEARAFDAGTALTFKDGRSDP